VCTLGGGPNSGRRQLQTICRVWAISSFAHAHTYTHIKKIRRPPCISAHAPLFLHVSGSDTLTDAKAGDDMSCVSEFANMRQSEIMCLWPQCKRTCLLMYLYVWFNRSKLNVSSCNYNHTSSIGRRFPRLFGLFLCPAVIFFVRLGAPLKLQMYL